MEKMKRNYEQIFGQQEGHNNSEDGVSPSVGSIDDISEERDRLLQEMRISLIQCGWRDEMKSICIELINSSGGLSEISMEELTSKLKDEGKPLVPDDVKASIILKLEKHISADDKCSKK